MLVRTTADNIIYYVYGLGLIGEQSQNGYRVYHPDFRGSTVMLTNNSGEVTDRYMYDAYGNLMNHQGNSDSPFLYNGQYGIMTDGNGLVYMRARYYNPEVRRFVSQDSVEGDLLDTMGLNQYVYCGGDPIRFIDPTGQFKEGDERFSDDILAELLSYTIIWLNADAAANLGIIDKYEKRAVQAYAEREADRIRYQADHPYKTALNNTLDFIVNDVILGDINGGIVNAAELSEPAMDKMYSKDNLFPIMLTSQGFTGGNSRTYYQTDIKGRKVRIDFERPTGLSSGNVHIHIGESKIFIESIEDIQSLPKSIRKNSEIIKWVTRALKALSRFE